MQPGSARVKRDQDISTIGMHIRHIPVAVFAMPLGMIGMTAAVQRWRRCSDCRPGGDPVGLDAATCAGTGCQPIVVYSDCWEYAGAVCRCGTCLHRTQLAVPGPRDRLLDGAVRDCVFPDPVLCAAGGSGRTDALALDRTACDWHTEVCASDGIHPGWLCAGCIRTWAVWMCGPQCHPGCRAVSPVPGAPLFACVVGGFVSKRGPDRGDGNDGDSDRPDRLSRQLSAWRCCSASCCCCWPFARSKRSPKGGCSGAISRDAAGHVRTMQVLCCAVTVYRSCPDVSTARTWPVAFE